MKRRRMHLESKVLYVPALPCSVEFALFYCVMLQLFQIYIIFACLGYSLECIFFFCEVAKVAFFFYG